MYGGSVMRLCRADDVGGIMTTAQTSAALPQAQVDVTMPSMTGSTIKVAAGGDLQAAINAAKPGDEIVLAAGAAFTGSYTLPNKAGDGWVTIRSAGPLPPEGTRATVADASGMATIMAPGSNAPALQTDPGAHNYRIIGLNVTAAPSVTQMTSLVNLGSGSADQNTVASEPQNIVIDRSYIHGSDTLDLRRGVALNSASTAIIDSTISDVHSKGSDSQAIAGWNGTGPYLIQNNNLEAAGENIMFGGADPSIPNALPSDITIRGNDITKPPSWKGVWLVKNLLELKIGQRVLVEDNNLSNNWVDGQSGSAVNFKSTNQEGTAPWSNTSNVTFRNNVIQNSPSGISIAARPEQATAVPASNLSITGNTFTNIGGADGTTSGDLFGLYGYGGSLNNVSIQNNKALQGDGNLNSTISFDGQPTQGLNFSNNVLTQGGYGIKGSGAADGVTTLAAFAPGVIFTGNTLAGGTAGDYGTYAEGNSFPATYVPGTAAAAVVSITSTAGTTGTPISAGPTTLADTSVVGTTGTPISAGQTTLADTSVAGTTGTPTSAGPATLADTSGAGKTGDAGANSLPAIATDGSTLSSVTFDSALTFYGPNVARLTGTASDPSGISGIEIYEGTKYLGPAKIYSDGTTWSFIFSNGSGIHTGITAVATSNAGSSATATSDLDFTTGITGELFTAAQNRFDPVNGDFLGQTFFKRDGSVLYASTYTALHDGGERYVYSGGSFFDAKPYSSFTNVYQAGSPHSVDVFHNRDGTHTITAEQNGQTLHSIGADTMTGTGYNDGFVFSPSFGHDTVTNFNVAGPGHDVLSLPQAEMANLAQIIGSADTVNGDTTLHINQHDSITLQGVSVAEIKANPNDFKLRG